MNKNICKKCNWLVGGRCKNPKVDTTDTDTLERIFNHAGVNIITAGCEQFNDKKSKYYW